MTNTHRQFVLAFFIWVISTACNYGGSSSSVENDEQDSQNDIQIDLSLSKTIDLPINNPVGIASDGEKLWILSDPKNAITFELKYLDAETNQIEKTTVIELIHIESGTYAHGLAYDGQYLWFTLLSEFPKIVQVDKDSGDIIKYYSIQAEGQADLTWGSNMLWISTGNASIFTVSPDSGETNEFSSVDAPHKDLGITFYDNKIWWGDALDNSITLYNPVTKEELGTIDSAVSYSGLLTFHKGQLLVLGDGGLDFYDLSQ